MSKLRKFREKVLTLGYSYFYAKTLLVAVKLGIFDAIGEGTQTAEGVANTLSLNPRATALLLDALTGLGFLEKENGLFSNTPLGSEIFLKGKPHYVGDMLGFHNNIWEQWSRLDEAIRTGKALREPDMFQRDKSETRNFIMAMHSTAMGNAPILAKNIKLKGAKTLIDIGGGPGTYSIFFCEANPVLKATIFDLPATLEITLEIISSFGISARISLLEGDYNKTIPGVYDAAFLSHVIHSEGEEANRSLLKKVYGALNPGGRVIIQDFFLNPEKTSPAFGAVFSLNMLLHTAEGRSYSCVEVGSWLKEAGFQDIKRPKINLPRDISIVMARRPG